MKSTASPCFNKFSAPSARRKAFTLIEVLGAAAIVAILLALLFPAFNEMRISAQKAGTITKMRNLHTAFLGYAADRDGRIPPAYSSAQDEYGKTYGSWMHYLNTGGYIQPPSPNVTQDLRFSCKRQLSQFTPTSGDLRTLAMNDRIGDHPTYSPQGARRMTLVVKPSATALLLNGPWDGAQIDTVTKENYVDLMKSAPPFHDSVLVLFIDGHVEVRPLDTIPRQIGETAELDGYNFWRGGVRNP